MRSSSIDSSGTRDLTIARALYGRTSLGTVFSGTVFSHTSSSRPWSSRSLALAAVLCAAACSDDAREPSTVSDPLLGPDTGEPREPGGPTLPDGSGFFGSGDASELVGLVDGESQPAACSDRFAPAAARPPVIQLVVDTSGSMAWVPGTDRNPESGEQSKWQITQQALATAIAAMPNEVALGVTYYPNTQQNGQCFLPQVAAPLATLSTEQRQQIQQVNTATRPFGATPTHGAYAFGVEQLQASQLEGARFVLLITDGVPTLTRECEGNGRTKVDSAPLIADVAAGFQQDQIRTFVIGSPGSEGARAELSEMALVGGTAAPGCTGSSDDFCHFDMTAEPDFSTALNAALAQITRSTLSCDYGVPSPPGGLRLDYDDVSVVLESGGSSVRELGRAGAGDPAAGDCASGWQYAADRKSIHLCSSTCDELQGLLRDDPGLEVRIRFGCSTRPR
jgi:von Willebrand factor type A domain